MEEMASATGVSVAVFNFEISRLCTKNTLHLRVLASNCCVVCFLEELVEQLAFTVSIQGPNEA